MNFFFTFTTILLLLVGQGHAQSMPEKAKLALKSGDSQKILPLLAEKLQFSLEGEGAMVSAKEASSKLSQFFKANSPSDLQVLFQGQSKDGRQYFIGLLKSTGGNYRISVYWSAQSKDQILSLDISKE
jgi:hypothetical protein